MLTLDFNAPHIKREKKIMNALISIKFVKFIMNCPESCKILVVLPYIRKS